MMGNKGAGVVRAPSSCGTLSSQSRRRACRSAAVEPNRAAARVEAADSPLEVEIVDRSDSQAQSGASGWHFGPDDAADGEFAGQAGSALKQLSIATLLGLPLLGGAGVMGSGFSLEGPASTIEAVSVLALIIFVHESGHFLAARLQNIHVSQFAVG